MLAPTAASADGAGLPPLTGAFLLALVAAAVAGSVTTGVHGSVTPVRRGVQAKTPLRLLATPTIRIALVSMVVSHVVMVALMVAAPLHMHHHGGGLGAVGTVISLHVLGMYALAPLTGYLTDRYGSRRVLVAGVATVGASTVVLVGAAHLSGRGSRWPCSHSATAGTCPSLLAVPCWCVMSQRPSNSAFRAVSKHGCGVPPRSQPSPRLSSWLLAGTSYWQQCA